MSAELAQSMRTLYSTHSASGTAPDRQIDSTTVMHVVHLARLKPPRKAAGQMDLRSRQDVQA
jgi:hypothetical protein